jgi:hypothetical protein
VQSDGTLVITPIQKATDAGVYTCSAKNKQGHSAKRSGEVTVIGKILSLCQQKWLFGFQILSVSCKANGRKPLINRCSPAIFRMCSHVNEFTDTLESSLWLWYIALWFGFMGLFFTSFLSWVLNVHGYFNSFYCTYSYYLFTKPDSPKWLIEMRVLSNGLNWTDDSICLHMKMETDPFSKMPCSV